MKKLYFLLALALISFSSFSQTLRFRLTQATINTNVNGLPINKGDEFDMFVWVNPNNNTTTRALYFDFEYQNTAFELVTVAHTGTVGNGGALPAGSQISMDTFTYPGYSWLSTQQNSVVDGNIRYQNARYNFVSGGSKTILRVYLNWALSTQNQMAEWQLLRLRFRLRTNAPGFNWDPIRMNFVAAFNQNGSWGSTIMEVPETSIIALDPIATSYINGSIELNSNLTNISPLRVAFIDSLTNQGPMFDVTSDGKINIDQSQLKANTTYRVMAMVNMDNLNSIYNAAVTVSDFTTAQSEFTSQNLDGTFKNVNIRTGMGYLAADVNLNKTFDGGDVVRIFSQSVSVDQLVALPQGYAQGSNGFMSVPTFEATQFNNYTTDNWKNAPNVLHFRTGNIGTNLPLNLKYALFGDINRSHSSQVLDMQGIPKINSISGQYINTKTPASPIDVRLANIVVNSDNIEIPISISTNTTRVSGLQFEFIYDHTKIKFEEIKSTLPNGWFVFGTPKNGKIKFGAVDRELKHSITGNVVPFTLKFSSLVSGLDITTQVKVGSTMDASDDKGNQLGVNLNTTIIKLNGYNNFNN
jgi:hypothetical protein